MNYSFISYSNLPKGRSKTFTRNKRWAHRASGWEELFGDKGLTPARRALTSLCIWPTLAQNDRGSGVLIKFWSACRVALLLLPELSWFCSCGFFEQSGELHIIRTCLLRILSSSPWWSAFFLQSSAVKCKLYAHLERVSLSSIINIKTRIPANGRVHSTNVVA